jgi:hypothetical protein
VVESKWHLNLILANFVERQYYEIEVGEEAVEAEVQNHHSEPYTRP